MTSVADVEQIRLNENLHVRFITKPTYTNRVYTWPAIKAKLDPILVSDFEETIAPEDKETVGVFVCVNDNDTDADTIIDNVDPEVVSTNMVGDPELLPLKLRHPRGLPVSLTVDDPSILRLYETVTKNYYPHRPDLSSEAGDILPNAPYQGHNDDDVVFAEGVQTGSTFVRLSGPGGHEDALKVTVLKVDMTAHRPQNIPVNNRIDFNKTAVPDGLEEDPGAGIRFNAANDNKNLIEVLLEVGPDPAPTGAVYFLRS